MSNALITRGTLPLYLFACLKHPVERTRQELRRRLLEWVEACEPQYTEAQIDTVLQNVSGTALEPFRLDGPNRFLANALCRLAFSRTHRRFRVLINSTFNPQAQGGLVLTNNLKYFFVERLACAARTKNPQNAWSFNPGRCPEVGEAPRTLSATGCIGEQGYVAWLTVPGWLQNAWSSVQFGLRESRAHELGLGSRVVGGQSLVDEGVEIWTHQHRLHLALRRPEQMIRLGPRLLSPEGLSLVLRAEIPQRSAWKPELPWLTLRWRVEGEAETPLECTPHLPYTDLNQWCSTGEVNAPEVPEPLKLELKDCIALP